jgi:hypothetical protein
MGFYTALTKLPTSAIPSIPFKMKEAHTERGDAPHFEILKLEARDAHVAHPPISLQCNERNNVQGGGISLSPEGSLLCYAPKIISQFKLESSSTGSSFPANLAKPVPFAVGSRARI